MAPAERMQQLDAVFSHVWMVRTFLKHSEEAEEDDELQQVHRILYDVMLALGKPLNDNDPETYLKQVRKKHSKLKRATALFLEIQPEISEHTNFKMAARSLQHSMQAISNLLDQD